MFARNLNNFSRWNLGSAVVVFAFIVAAASFTMANAAKPVPTGKSNYERPFEPPTRSALIPLPPGAVEPEGWLRDWCLTAKDGYTGHMNDVDIARQFGMTRDEVRMVVNLANIGNKR